MREGFRKIYFLILHENICCGYLLKVPQRGASNEYHNISYYNKINTLQPLYNTVRYNMVLDITRFKDGSQKCIDCIEK